VRRIDILGIGVGIFLAGGLVYLVLQQVGLGEIEAGIWSQVFLVGGLIGWLCTYLFRVVTHEMTYSKQLKDYEEAVLQKRLESLTAEELAKIQAEIEGEM